MKIKANDREALLDFLDTQEVTITIECCGFKKTFKESDCSKAVGNRDSRGNELLYLFAKRSVELAREVLFARGGLELPERSTE